MAIKSLINLFEIVMFAAWTATPGTYASAEKKNIAFNKPAAQSSTNDDFGKAKLAVDGSTYGTYNRHSSSCSHTAHQTKGPHYWNVDLERKYSISEIKVWNREGCCQERLRNLVFYLSSDKPVTESPQEGAVECGFFKGPLKGPPFVRHITISCDGKIGRYVSIVKTTNEYLTLCEVEVFPFAASKEKYELKNGKLNFEQAKKICENWGKRLAVISRKSDGQLAKSASAAKDHLDCPVNLNNKHCLAFIGYKRIGNTKTFKPIDGRSSTYRNWHPNEPNNEEGDQNCVEFNSYDNDEWNDIQCVVRLSALCEASFCNEHGSSNWSSPCTCHKGYTGDRCEKCMDKYFNGNTLTVCKKCDCNEKGITPQGCNKITGQCECSPGYKGKKCDMCAHGYYQDSNDVKVCQPCTCNARGSSNCTYPCKCHQGYSGNKCDKCSDKYYGKPTTVGCQQCDCTKQGATSQNCDTLTGQCKCRSGNSGQRCDHCANWYYNDSNVCQPCTCNEPGSFKCTPPCQCRQGYLGYLCDECSDNYYGNATIGCQKTEVKIRKTGLGFIVGVSVAIACVILFAVMSTLYFYRRKRDKEAENN